MLSKKLILRIGLIVAVAFVVFLGYLFVVNFLKATLTIKVDDSSSVSIHKLDVKKTRVWSGTGSESFHVKLSKGSYSVLVTKEYSATKQVIDLDYREVQTIEPKLTAPLSAVQVFSNGSDSVASTPGGIVQIDGSSGNAISSSGAAEVDTYGLQVSAFAHSPTTNTFAFVTSDGQLYVSSSGASRSVAGDSVVMIEYDEASDQFCALTQNKKIIFVSSSGEVTKTLYINNVATAISCSGGQAIYFDVTPIFDDKVDAKLRRSTIHLVGDLESAFDADEVSAAVLSEDGKFIYHTGGGSLSKIDTASGVTTSLLDVASVNRNAVKIHKDKIIVFDDGEAWLVDPSSRLSSRLLSGYNFSGLTSSSIDASGSLIFSINSGLGRGTFATTGDTGLAEFLREIGVLFPYSSEDFSIETSFDGNKVSLVVTILAPIPSSGNLSQYNQAKVEAQSYIDTLGLDTSKYNVTFR